MSPCFEFEGKTVERAVQKACEELNLPKEKLRHDVISYGSTGIFGLVGTKKARIRVTVPDAVPEPVQTLKKEDPTLAPETAGPVTAEAPRVEPASDACVLYMASDDPRVVGKEALQRILDAVTDDAQILIEERSGRFLFNVKGGNSAVLIGKRGQTLEAIQYLVEKIVNKGTEERVRVQVDVEGYLKNRRVNLQKLAGRMAEKVKRTGKPATIGQMNAHDRRIVHVALREDSAVRTQSMGDGYLRKLVIFPRKNSSNRKRPEG